MATTAVPFREVIPPEFTAALEAQPDDFDLRRAIIDRMLELGLEAEAEAIRWSVEKRRVPDNHCHWDDDLRGSWERCCTPYDLFYATFIRGLGVSVCGTFTAAFNRLICRWLNCTPKQHAEFWAWEPDGGTT